jgi:hypothetical protein
LAATYREIPKDKLRQMNFRVHPGFKRQIQHRAIDEGMSVDELMHNLLGYVLGEPGPYEPRLRQPLARSSAS